ncbi:hypothetical protein EGW08_001869 [Elysia chlorotica]|uniref:DUF4139 domain-containing protein n=1 Tax=Elysia chlorotica TaxID=188477 RepID=A0A433U952_ELYCH|nr:hypothetical protein EGW08_001869 [Elysia chlorotica]
MAQVSEMNCLYVKAADCPMTKVTVYTDRAEVCRRHECKLKSGKNELHVTHFVEADEDSIRVEGHGKATIAEVSFQSKQNKDKEPAMMEEEKALKDEIEKLTAELKEGQFESQLCVLGKQKDILDRFANTASSPGQGSSNESFLKAEYFQGVRDFLHQYKDLGRQLDTEKFDVENKRDALTKKITDTQQKLEQLLADRNSGREKKECIIVLEAEEETNVTLAISYIVYGASWTPLYDLRMFPVEGTLKITYYGVISQSSGEDWTDVQVSLSTAEPVLGGSIPILAQTQLSVAAPVQAQANYSWRGLKAKASAPRMRASSHMDAPMMQMCVMEDSCMEYREPLNVDTLKITEGLTSATYEIARPSTIPSDASPHKVTVATLDTKPTLSYLTVPSKVAHAFLKAKVVNTSSYILLPGPTNIFLDNTSVGKAHLSSVAPQEEFECSLGVDPGVRVEYRPASEVKSSSGLISKATVIQHRQVIQVKNTHAYAVEVKVRDNLPRSRDERIKVKLLEPVIDVKKPEKAAKDVVLTLENHVEWDLTIPSMEKSEVVLVYTVEHPSDSVLETYEVLGAK